MLLNQQLFRTDGTQVALYPLAYMKITQGVNAGYSHRGRLTIDDAGKDGGIDNVYAPFDCKVVWKQTTGDKTGVLIQSLNEVWVAKGIKSYVVMILWHDNDTKDLYVGRVIKQGEIFYQEGTAGQATGNHIHYGCSFTRYTGGYPLVKNPFGNWEIKNEVHPADVFFINDTVLLRDAGYDWKIFKEVVITPPPAQNLQVGDKVKITGTHYSTGQPIPPSVKLRTHTIAAMTSKKSRLKEINSWVNNTDLKEV